MRLSIATRIFLGFAAVLVTSALVSIYGVVLVRRIGAGLSLVSSGYFPLTRAAGSLEAFQKERARSTDRLVDEKDPAVRRSLVDLDRTYFARALGDKLARAREQVASMKVGLEASDRESLERIEARLATLVERIGVEEQAAAALDLALERLEQGGGAERTQAPRDLPALRDPVERLQAAQRRVDYEIKALLDVIQGQMNRGVGEAEAQERNARWAIVGLSLLSLLVGLFITFFAQRALRPISALTEAAQALGRGAPDAVAAVPESGSDELAVLAHEFNAMAQRLAARERQLKAQSEALLRSERLATIGRIAAQITHEIRNPLSAIGLNAEELSERLEQVQATEAARTACAAIVREVDRLAAITEEYLRFARLPRSQPNKAEVNDLVRDLLTFVKPELDAGGVRLEESLADALPPVSMDVGQIRQLLLNLVRNAREAMPGGGTLSVRTSQTPRGARIEVQDQGQGIPPERLQRIFDPFFTTKERGTGLGLALAQEIAQEHGGQLTCASVVGQGATFALELPASA
ncbi:MAG: HAMP domain-containing protein [Deltaproteobacteria bacterium]|nr:HAMP domain-containing protein [Deltaproteobacteria bacterium]